MKMHYYCKLLLFACLVCITTTASAQKRTTIVKGYVYEKGSSSTQKATPIPRAVVSVPDLGISVATKSDGSFELKNIPEGENSIVVSFLGYESIKQTVSVSSGMPNVVFQMEESTFRIEEVVVTAKQKRTGASTTSVIGRTAMEHIQASNLQDVLQLLPGADPNLRSDLVTSNYMQLRGGASLGVSVLRNGAPISNNANMQQLNSATGSYATAGLKNQSTGMQESSPHQGVDLRTITTDNIESIEVIRGVPSAEHGDLTSGAVLITTKAGVDPLRIKANTNPNIYAFGATKGFDLGGERGRLNVSADYAYSVNDPTEASRNYARTTASVLYGNNFFDDFWTSNTSVDYSYVKQLKKPVANDPNDVESIRAISNTISINTWGSFNFNKGWFKRIDYNLSGTYGDRKDNYSNVLTNASVAYSQSLVDGTVLTSTAGKGAVLANGTKVTNSDQSNLSAFILPSTYTSIYDVLGTEINVFAKVKGTFAGEIGATNHKIVIGSDFRSFGNTGKGVVFDAKLPPYRAIAYEFATQRNRAFSDIPFYNQIAVFAEENFKYEIAERELNIQVGGRYDHVQSFGGALTPRVNLSFDILPRNLRLTASYGITAKMPTMLMMNPDNAYFDLLNFNNASVAGLTEAQKYQVITTKVFDVNTSDLKMNKVEKMELRLDYTINKMRFSVNAYREETNTGYSTTFDETTFPVVDYIQYTSAAAVPGEWAPLNDAYVTNKLMLAYTRPQNNLWYVQKGIEFEFDFGRVDAIRTSFNLNGSYSTKTFGKNGYTFWNQSTGTDYSKYPDMGIFAKNMEINHVQSTRTNLRITHNIPSIGLVATLTTSVLWRDFAYTEYNNDEIPVMYISRLDGKIYDFDPAKIDDPAFKGIDRRGAVKADRHVREGVMPPVMNMNINVTKELGDFLRVSFFANNIFRSTPAWQSQKDPGVWVRRNPNAFFFGIELSAIIK